MDGYKIIDFKGVNPSDGGEVPGIYNAIDESTKPICVYNIGATAATLKPYFAQAIKVPTSPTTNAYYITYMVSEGVPVFAIVNDDDSIDVQS